jgi:hypothetical protein
VTRKSYSFSDNGVSAQGKRHVNHHVVKSHNHAIEVKIAHCILTYEAEFTTQRGIQNLLRQEPYKGTERDSRVKFGKETVAGAHRKPKGP